MTATPRPDVTKALADAGWIAVDRPVPARWHRSGAALVFQIRNDNCVLWLPDGGPAHVGFLPDIPDAVVLAACLAASGQLDPAQAPPTP